MVVLHDMVILISILSAGRRRSSRLIESRWVFNWPKKPAVFVNLGEDEIGNSKHEVDGENKSGKKKEVWEYKLLLVLWTDWI